MVALVLFKLKSATMSSAAVSLYATKYWCELQLSILSCISIQFIFSAFGIFIFCFRFYFPCFISVSLHRFHRAQFFVTYLVIDVFYVRTPSHPQIHTHTFARVNQQRGARETRHISAINLHVHAASQLFARLVCSHINFKAST